MTLPLRSGRENGRMAPSLYKTRMEEATTFVESLHYVPEGNWSSGAFSVLRAGKVVAGPDYGIERAVYPGQDILYCLSGAGGVRTAGQRLEVQAGQLVWIANEEPHAHYADPASPWTLLWFRLDGPNLPAVRRRLFGAGALRVSMPGDAILSSWFDRLFSVMRGREFGQDLRLNQLVGEFFVIVDRALARSESSGRAEGARRRSSRPCANARVNDGARANCRRLQVSANRRSGDSSGSTCA